MLTIEVQCTRMENIGNHRRVIFEPSNAERLEGAPVLARTGLALTCPPGLTPFEVGRKYDLMLRESE